MSSDAIIRKANKDYICSCCGHIIRKGDEYIDRCTFNVGKIVKHDRYHDECPRYSDVSRLFARVELENGDLICSDTEGRKIHIVGVYWGNKGPMLLYREWDGNEKKASPVEYAYSLIDANGGSIL